MGSEGEGEGGPGQWKALDFVLNFKTMNSAKKLFGCFSFGFMFPNSFIAFLPLDNGSRKVNVFLNIACNFS